MLGWQQIWPTDTIYNQLPHTNCRHFPFFLLRSEITLTPHIIILGSRPGMMCVRSLMRITDCVSDIRIAHSQRLRNQCDRIHTHNFPRNDCGHRWNETYLSFKLLETLHYAMGDRFLLRHLECRRAGSTVSHILPALLLLWLHKASTTNQGMPLGRFI